MLMATPPFNISVPPFLNRDVDYLSEISVPVQITSTSPCEVVVESIALRFQSDWKVPGPDVTVAQQFTDFIVRPDALDYRNVRVRPYLVFRPYTNVFDVLITYRLSEESGLGCQSTQVAREASYLIIQPARKIFDSLFVSYKEPEDLDLAKLAFTLAERAGFVPYIAPEDIQPGTKIWEEKIEKAIKRSKATIVIWTASTPFGSGVPKEIEISRSAGVRIIPFLEQGVPKPEVYDASIEYTLFERNNAASVFANVLRLQRGRS